jgi:hypothetical protein
MRDKRRRDALANWPLKADWPTEFRQWNEKHNRKYIYGDLAEFKRYWKLANPGKKAAHS